MADSTVPGLSYYDNFLTSDDEDDLIDTIYDQSWDTRLSRRVQHYGHLYKYNHVKNESNDKSTAKPVPDWLSKLYKKLVKKGIAPDVNMKDLQVIINEYKPGQGIGKHVDDTKQFDKFVISVSLNSGCEVVFEKVFYGRIRKVYVDRCSVYKMEKDARYSWTHAIMPAKIDTIVNSDGSNEKIERKTRISITFRKMLV